MLYKVANGRVSIHCTCSFQLGGSWLVDGGGEAEGAEVESNNGRRRGSYYSADKMHKQKASIGAGSE